MEKAPGIKESEINLVCTFCGSRLENTLHVGPEENEYTISITQCDNCISKSKIE